MATFENRIGFASDIPLEPDDITDEVLDALHSPEGARRIVQAVMRGPRPLRYQVPADIEDDAALFEEVMR